MDGDFQVDITEIARNIETGEIISIYFPLLRKALLVDTRCDVENEPLVKLMPMVDSVEERFRSIRRLRPRFPRPESVTVIPWPKYVDSLLRLGIWDRLLTRLTASGYKNAVRACNQALDELRGLERLELARVITGENYHTLWRSRRSRF